VSGVDVQVREVLTGEAYATLASGERRLAMPGRYDLEARTVPPTTFEGIAVTPGRESIVRREGLSRLLVAPPRGVAGPYRLEVLTPAGDRRLGEALGPAPERRYGRARLARSEASPGSRAAERRTNGPDRFGR
jgi:hypothetical protein